LPHASTWSWLNQLKAHFSFFLVAGKLSDGRPLQERSECFLWCVLFFFFQKKKWKIQI
jgi:hypothetical protein